MGKLPLFFLFQVRVRPRLDGNSVLAALPWAMGMSEFDQNQRLTNSLAKAI